MGTYFNGNSTGLYVTAQTNSSTTYVTVSRSVAAYGTGGFATASTGTNATTRLFITESLVDSNVNLGVGAYTTVGATGQVSEVSVSNSLIVGNGTALRSTGTGSKFVASGNTVINNTYGLMQEAPSVFESAGNNTVRNNGTNVVNPPLTNIGTM